MGNHNHKKIRGGWSIYIASLILIGLSGALWAFGIGCWDKVPAEIHVRVGSDERIELNVPLSGIIYPIDSYFTGETIVNSHRNETDSGETYSETETIRESEEKEVIQTTAQSSQRVGIPVRFSEPIVVKANRVQDYRVQSKLFGVIPYKNIDIHVIEDARLTPAGIPIGIYVKTKGPLVVGIGNFESDYGRIVEPAKYKLQNGDYIMEIDGEAISGKKDLVRKIQESKGKELQMKVQREDELIEVAVQPVKAQAGKYRIGAWVRDNAQGIGTLTFVGENGEFGALGHGINDMDTSTLMDLSAGAMYQTNIVGVRKGEQGAPGEITGYISYDKEHKMGEIVKNTKAGIFGICGDEAKEQCICESMPIALKQEIVEGPAAIICSATGVPKEYAVQIDEVRMDSENINRGIVLTVTDQELLGVTGGIVQGMSGSPIIQNGKIVGAVTHVFVNDPTKGYGVLIETMLAQ